MDEVGLTDDHELVIHWWCEECKRVVYASKSLADCWHDCPKNETTAMAPQLAAEPPAARSGFDDRFLKSLGIRQMDEA